MANWLEQLYSAKPLEFTSPHRSLLTQPFLPCYALLETLPAPSGRAITYEGWYYSEVTTHCSVSWQTNQFCLYISELE